MHPIDQLHAKRTARDKAEKEYQEALEEVRHAYPWLRIDDQPQPDKTLQTPQFTLVTGG